MNPAEGSNDAQVQLWNGPAARAWVDARDILDQVLGPYDAHLLEVATTARRVLDVGCGTGGTTIGLARTVDGECTGVDISEPMIAVARERAAREHVAAQFVLADAQSYPFEEASVDAIVSRFGVMFFADPVRAFANLRRTATADARLRFLAWRSPAENPFMTTAERAAAPLLPELPTRRPDEPGQFAFADPDRVARILGDAGWSDVSVQPLDQPCELTVDQLDRYLSQVGPVGMLLADADEDLRARVFATVRAAFEPFVDGTAVRFSAACWLVDGRAA